MLPEQKARAQIDQQLAQAGWLVQDASEIDISAGLGVAIREFSLAGGEADYLLYVDGKAIGGIEAKPEGHTLKGVEVQSLQYLSGLPDSIPSYGRPLPFHYESTGKVTQFTNLRDPDPRSREVFTFHQPAELLRLVKLDQQHRALLRQMPALHSQGLWHVQSQAIQNLEKSLADNRPRSLIQMATGSGKTFTAVSFIYRLIKFAQAKRILFLVDRKNLGRQTLAEFHKYESPNSQYKFSEEYNVQLLRKNVIDPASRVCITTIQRLYSMLKGEEEFDEENEEGSMFEAGSAAALAKQPLPVVYNPAIPIETFDYIVTDECHRSIYNLWRQVLEYFDASLIGLTATPSKQTIGFFFNNLVMEYGHTAAVADGVNVGFDVYRINTQITQGGAKLEAEPGFLVPRRDRRTRERRLAELDEDLPYKPNQLDREVVCESQVRLILRTFRDRLFTEIFPGRTEVPKTLIFAKDDSHAEDITRIAREEFGRGNDFCQKITYRTTGKKPEDLLSDFRNSFNPRIAVTVDMIATGTDVKPLECLLFMRNINSSAYYEQMKGRGCRIIDCDALRSVTPDAKLKDRFVLVDAVGVTESCKSDSRPLDRKPSVPLNKLIELVGKGAANYDLASTLAARLSRLDQQLSTAERNEIAEAAGGVPLTNLVTTLLSAIDDDVQEARAREAFVLGAADTPSEQQVQATEQKLIAAALKPFHSPKLRRKILDIKRIHEQVIDEVNQDELLAAGYAAAANGRATALVASFKQFIADNRDELEAIKFFYSRPQREGLKYADLKRLAAELERSAVGASPDRVWAAFQIVEPQAVKGQWGKLVDTIALVRHALDPALAIEPYSQTVEERYAAWLAEKTAAGAVFTADQQRWLDAIKNHIAASLRIEADDFDNAPFAQLGGLGKAHQLFGDALTSLLSELNDRLAA